MAQGKGPVNDQVLTYIKAHGPILPVDVSRLVQGNTLLAGAVLAELRERQLIKVSACKIGSSPVYYVEGQEPKLDMLVKYLPLPERKAYDLIKAKRVLRDSILDTALRVSLRRIRDFALPLNVKTQDGNSEIFWKWHLLGDEDTKEGIAEILTGISKAALAAQEEQAKADAAAEAARAAGNASHHATPASPATPSAKHVPSKLEAEQAARDKPEKPKRASAPRANSGELAALRRELDELKKQLQIKPTEKPLEEFDEPAHSIEEQAKEDPWLGQVHGFCVKNSIEIMDFKIIRKNNEIDLTIRLPTAVGSVEYFCKAKNKKRIAEGDLSTTLLQGQNIKLPALFLSPGDLTKTAETMLATEFKGLAVRKIT